MPSSTVNICVLTLVLLSFHQICHCRPHRSKRGLVKDYQILFPDTLVFPSDKFEKGEDGKYYLKKSAHRQDSEVNYISADSAVKENGLAAVGEVDTVKDNAKIAETVINTEPIKKELTEKDAEFISSSAVVKETAEKIDKDEKAPFTPVDTKFTVPPKPDAKDEVALKTDIPLAESEEKEKEKVSIGQVPELASRLVPLPENIRIPILIPIRHISYRAMKIIPLPPADVSDRLPVPYEDDIVGEGAHESESEVVSEPIAEKESGYPIGNPLMSLLSFHNVLKELKEADKGDIEKESKVVDVLGKKFLMQSNVMKYPSNDNGHTFIRFLSMKPLDEMKPEEPKAIASEETLKKELDVEERKSTEVEKEKSTVKDVIKKEKDISEPEMKKENEEKLVKEADILKGEETELKMKIEKNVPKDIMIENAGKEEVDGKMKNAEKEIISVEKSFKETDEHQVTQPQMRDVDLKLVMESKEMDITEKAESQMKAKENKGTEMKKEAKMKEEDEKVEESSITDAESFLKTMKDVKAVDKKIEVDDILMKKYDEKKMDMDSKKELFLLEKKKKEKSMDGMEEIKHKKKIEKKKKKCKCEEKDSDSEDDIDE